MPETSLSETLHVSAKALELIKRTAKEVAKAILFITSLPE
jgi:hypothetical protein